MDLAEKWERKKKIRKMASGMLWADFKSVVCSWRVLILILLEFTFGVLAFAKSIDDYNVGACFYFITWILLPLSAQIEKAFNYLPLTSKEVLYYLKYRTNLMASWVVFFWGIAGIVMDMCGIELFVERAVVSLIMMLATLEWEFQVMLFSYNEGNGKIMDSPLPKGKRVRFVIYVICMFGMMVFSMIYAMFMEPAGKGKLVAMILALLYVCMYLTRADVATCFRFDEYRKVNKRTLYANQGMLKEQK